MISHKSYNNPITKEMAKALYDAKIDEACPGPMRVNYSRVWWRLIDADSSNFLTFCQYCYYHDRLTLPCGTKIEKKNLVPALIKGYLCNCDGNTRENIEMIQLNDQFNCGVFKVKHTTIDYIDDIFTTHTNISSECIYDDESETLFIPSIDDDNLELFFSYDSVIVPQKSFIGQTITDFESDKLIYKYICERNDFNEFDIRRIPKKAISVVKIFIIEDPVIFANSVLNSTLTLIIDNTSDDTSFDKKTEEDIVLEI